MVKTYLKCSITVIMVFHCWAAPIALGNPSFKSTPTFGPIVTIAPTSDAILAPKCFPETAVAYFLPVPPLAPRVTVLNPDYKDLQLIQQNSGKITQTCNNFPSKLTGPAPQSFSVLPDVMDEIPLRIQDRFIRFAEDNIMPVTEISVDSNVADNLRIFNFDQELLDGFLNGLGL